MVRFRPEPIEFEQWFELVERHRAFAQPVYAESGVEAWPLFSIGSGFFFQFGNFIFFCMCRHQVQLAEGREIVVVHRHGFFPVTKMRSWTFEKSELVLFGPLKAETMLLPAVQTKDVIEWDLHMAAVGAIGYPTASAIQSFDPEKLTMTFPRDAGLMADELDLTASRQSWRLANENKWAAIANWQDLTNGFSGGPVAAIARVSQAHEPSRYESRLIGMTHAATSNPRELHVVPIWEIATRVMSIVVPQGGWGPEERAFLDRAKAFFDRGVLPQ